MPPTLKNTALRSGTIGFLQQQPGSSDTRLAIHPFPISTFLETQLSTHRSHVRRRPTVKPRALDPISD